MTRTKGRQQRDTTQKQREKEREIKKKKFNKLKTTKADFLLACCFSHLFSDLRNQCPYSQRFSFLQLK